MYSTISFLVTVLTIYLVTPAVAASNEFLLRQTQAQTSRIRPRGPAALTRAYSKYGVGVSSALARGAGRASATPDTGDQEYFVPVTIGGQHFELDFDTGSSDMYVSTYSPVQMKISIRASLPAHLLVHLG